jgi:hypothetical protein
MLKNEIPKNNWGKVLFHVRFFSIFASSIMRDKKSGNRPPDVAGRANLILWKTSKYYGKDYL